ncbi:hypothetical protein HNP24_000093 [Chryseobacterium sediminis]|uniref:Transposase n=1 Tax=Chryseobacterium sediminis TaxID=1679494 RepID=A0ABR6PTY2_9FLAO|nr:transposase [Chryseobacterium sediminis]MBB6329143.1 hypothetical protein [Chryseobacterium sediminis]
MRQKKFTDIHIGTMIRDRISECGVELSRICNFFKCREDEIEEMYSQKSFDTEILLKWSKLLQYDFFRVYSMHLILYSPPCSLSPNNTSSKLPTFRKNVYTQEMIEFILELIENKEKTKLQIIEEYGIPKTTLFKWITKYNETKTSH